MKRHLLNHDRPIPRRLIWPVNVLMGVICISVAAVVFDAGVRTSTRRNAVHSPSIPRARLSAPDAENIPAGADLPPGYVPIGIVRFKGDSFAMLELQNSPRSVTQGPGGGVAEVFDSDGHLLRRFAGVERANSSWEVIEYIRLSAVARHPGLEAEPITTCQRAPVSVR